MRPIKICKDCEILKETHAKGFCEPCYRRFLYKTNPLCKLKKIELKKKYPERQREYMSKYRKKNPVKNNARKYAYKHKQRRPYCLIHLFEGQEIPSIAFHHTDYETRMGFSACKEHHMEANNWLKEK